MKTPEANPTAEIEGTAAEAPSRPQDAPGASAVSPSPEVLFAALGRELAAKQVVVEALTAQNAEIQKLVVQQHKQLAEEQAKRRASETLNESFHVQVVGLEKRIAELQKQLVHRGRDERILFGHSYVVSEIESLEKRAIALRDNEKADDQNQLAAIAWLSCLTILRQKLGLPACVEAQATKAPKPLTEPNAGPPKPEDRAAFIADVRDRLKALSELEHGFEGTWLYRALLTLLAEVDDRSNEVINLTFVTNEARSGYRSLQEHAEALTNELAGLRLAAQDVLHASVRASDVASSNMDAVGASDEDVQAAEGELNLAMSRLRTALDLRGRAQEPGKTLASLRAAVTDAITAEDERSARRHQKRLLETAHDLLSWITGTGEASWDQVGLSCDWLEWRTNTGPEGGWDASKHTSGGVCVLQERLRLFCRATAEAAECELSRRQEKSRTPAMPVPYSGQDLVGDDTPLNVPPHPITFGLGDHNIGRSCGRCGFNIPAGCRYVHGDWCNARPAPDKETFDRNRAQSMQETIRAQAARKAAADAALPERLKFRVGDSATGLYTPTPEEDARTPRCEVLGCTQPVYESNGGRELCCPHAVDHQEGRNDSMSFKPRTKAAESSTERPSWVKPGAWVVGQHTGKARRLVRCLEQTAANGERWQATTVSGHTVDDVWPLSCRAATPAEVESFVRATWTEPVADEAAKPPTTSASSTAPLTDEAGWRLWLSSLGAPREDRARLKDWVRGLMVAAKRDPNRAIEVGDVVEWETEKGLGHFERHLGVVVQIFGSDRKVFKVADPRGQLFHHLPSGVRLRRVGSPS